MGPRSPLSARSSSAPTRAPPAAHTVPREGGRECKVGTRNGRGNSREGGGDLLRVRALPAPRRRPSSAHADDDGSKGAGAGAGADENGSKARARTWMKMAQRVRARGPARPTWSRSRARSPDARRAPARAGGGGGQAGRALKNGQRHQTRRAPAAGQPPGRAACAPGGARLDGVEVEALLQHLLGREGVSVQ